MRIVEFVGLVVALLVVMGWLVGRPHVLPAPGERTGPVADDAADPPAGDLRD